MSAGKWCAILAVDPGREKCGLAYLHGDVLVFKDVLERSQAIRQTVGLCVRVDVVVVGDGTGSEAFVADLVAEEPAIEPKVRRVNEHLSTVEARQRYWQEHPPTGLRRFLPVSLQVPPVPVDDYVAVILAERYRKNA